MLTGFSYIVDVNFLPSFTFLDFKTWLAMQRDESGSGQGSVTRSRLGRWGLCRNEHRTDGIIVTRDMVWKLGELQSAYNGYNLMLRQLHRAQIF